MIPSLVVNQAEAYRPVCSLHLMIRCSIAACFVMSCLHQLSTRAEARPDALYFGVQELARPAMQTSHLCVVNLLRSAGHYEILSWFYHVLI